MSGLHRSLCLRYFGKKSQNWQSVYEIRQMLVLFTLRKRMSHQRNHGRNSAFIAITISCNAGNVYPTLRNRNLFPDSFIIFDKYDLSKISSYSKVILDAQ